MEFDVVSVTAEGDAIIATLQIKLDAFVTVTVPINMNLLNQKINDFQNNP